MRGGKAALVVPNHLQRQCALSEPNKASVTDIAYIRTHEGWIYLAVVLNLLSRQVLGWWISSLMTKELALNASLMAVWRRKPQQEVLVHSDQQ